MLPDRAALREIAARPPRLHPRRRRYFAVFVFVCAARPRTASGLLAESRSAVPVSQERRLAGSEIAHLKMTLSPDGGLGDIAAIHLVRSDFVPELSLRLEAPVPAGQLIINCRAEADPDLIRAAVTGAVADLPAAFPGLTAQLDHLESFRPGKPQPTHRDATAAK